MYIITFIRFMPKLKTNKKKVVLFFPDFGVEQDVWMPFPYLYLAPFLEKEGYEIKIIDSRVDHDWRNILTKELKDSFALGVTSMSGPDLKPAMEASEIARGMNNKIHIIWGEFKRNSKDSTSLIGWPSAVFCS